MNKFYEIKETKWIFLIRQESCIYCIRLSWIFGSPVKL